MTLKNRTKLLARKFGIDIGRFNKQESPDARLFYQIKHHQIDLVLDIGANDGGYARFIRNGGYAGRILSFEPLQEAHAALTHAAQHDSDWRVFDRMALGDKDGAMTINVAGNSTSSSLLPMLKSHESAAPESKYASQQTCEVRKLDSISHPYLNNATNIFVKIDTQGYEMPVLKGGEKLLNRSLGLQIELSVTPLYKGQSLYFDIINHLEDASFELWNIIPGFASMETGRMLQMDGVFFRPPTQEKTSSRP